MKQPTGTPTRKGRSPVADKRNLEPAPKPAKVKRKSRKTKPPRRGNVVFRGISGTVGLIWRVIWGASWRLGMVVFLIIGAATAYYYTGLPQAEDLFDARARGSVTMLDRNGKVFAWRGETFGTVDSDQISPLLKHAVIATEDRRFYLTPGIDPHGIAGALTIDLADGRGPLDGNSG